MVKGPAIAGPFTIHVASSRGDSWSGGDSLNYWQVESER